MQFHHNAHADTELLAAHRLGAQAFINGIDRALAQKLARNEYGYSELYDFYLGGYLGAQKRAAK